MESKLHMTILDISDVDIETLNTTTGIDAASNAENKYNKLLCDSQRNATRSFQKEIAG